jgi:hypothetical protein
MKVNNRRPCKHMLRPSRPHVKLKEINPKVPRMTDIS